MKQAFLVLAVLGAIVPYVFFMQHFGAAGYAVADFTAAVFATPAASGFAADLLISSLVFWVYMFALRPAGPSPWPFIGLNLLIGLSCALPAYLYWRERGRDAGAVRGAPA